MPDKKNKNTKFKLLELRVNSLLKEYEALKSEILVQIQLYHRQTVYVLLYMSFLITVITFVAVEPSRVTGSTPAALKPGIEVSKKAINSLATEQTKGERPSGKVATGGKERQNLSKDEKNRGPVEGMIVIGLLICAACIPFYLITAMMSCTYIFFVLRRRMAVIENKLNQLLGIAPFFSYERVITPYFLEHSQYAQIRKYMPAFTPHALSALWRSLIFLAVIGELIGMAYIYLGFGVAFLLYSLLVVAASIFQLVHYSWLYRKGLHGIENVIRKAAIVNNLPDRP